MAGLPKVQLQKREALKAQLEPENKGLTMLPSMEQPPQLHTETPPEPVVEPEVIPLDKQWEITAKKWETKFNSLQGVIENLEPTLKKEKEQREQLEKELQKLREAMPQPAPQPNPDEDLTEDEMKVYENSLTVIQKVARKIAKGQVNEALKDIRTELNELREANKHVQVDLRTTSEAQFMEHVRSEVKGFDKVVQEPEWAEHLKQKAPFSRKTFYEKLQEAHAARDIDTIKEIFAGFKPTRAALERMKVPSLNGGGGSPLNAGPQQKPILKLSERKKLSEDVRMGRISRNSDEFKQKDAMFREAEAENRIDYNS